MPQPPVDEELFFGFNSEVSFRNWVYHVQTESMSGPPSPTINTLVYLKGTLVTKISSAASEPGGAGPDLHERVKKQHQSVLTRVRRGDFAP